MLDQGVSSVEADDLVEFLHAGAAAKGEFHCTNCGYGVTIQATLPSCPMCGGTSWEQTAWSPLSRAAAWRL